jgi:uracil-DNA glycosylase
MMKANGWSEILADAYDALEEEYRRFLEEDESYFPSQENYINAFKTLPKERVKYILFGQDPYPRRESAGGYAFIDMKVQHLFAPSGLSKEVNRATSLRNFIKMALVASGRLDKEDTSQEAIQKLDKYDMINSIEALRMNFEKNGVLLLNTALIFTDKKSSARHVKAWKPFMQKLLDGLKEQRPILILFGTHAKELKKAFHLDHFKTIELEHPYNHSFVTNPKAIDLFAPMALLQSHTKEIL